MDMIDVDICCAKAPCSRAQSRERDSQLSKQAYLKKQEKKEEKRMSRMRAAAVRDCEESTPKHSNHNVDEEADATTPVKTSKKPKSRSMSEDGVKVGTEPMQELTAKKADSNVEEIAGSDANLAAKSPKKMKGRTMSEDSNKENAKTAKELDADTQRGRSLSADENLDSSSMKQLRPRARSALKRQLEQEKAQSERRAKAEALEKAKEEAEAEAAAEAARARRQAKWEARQEAAILSAKKEEEPNPTPEPAAEADEEAAQLQALVAEAEAAAAALAKSKCGLIAEVDEIDLAEWEIV